MGRVTHGMKGTRLYNIWCGMKRRCYNKNDQSYVNYGYRGIKVCEKWIKFEGFKEDLFNSYLRHVNEFGEDNTSIERIDNNGDYELKNCKWATRKEQNSNTRQVKKYEHKGKMMNLTEISKLEGVNYRTLRDRFLYKGWSLEDSVKQCDELLDKKNYCLYEHKGKIKSVTEIAREEGINPPTLFGRLKEQGMSLEEALSVPDFQREFKATNLKTGETHIYKNQAQFAREFKFKSGSKISLVLKGQRKTAYGFTFEYTNS